VVVAVFQVVEAAVEAAVDGKNTMHCPFCAPEIQKRIIHEGKHVFAVLSDPRLVPGHLLIIPKRHVLSLSELKTAERSELMRTAIKFQELIVKNIAPGCDMRQNYRPFLPQSRTKVDHVHIHLLPRFFEDELYTKSMKFETGLFEDLKAAERKKFEKIYS